MPELPDIRLYVSRLQERLSGSRLQNLLIGSPFVLRSITPSPRDFESRQLMYVDRLGKRLVFEFEDDLFLVMHLMISGRLQWVSPLTAAKQVGGKAHLATFRFDSGQLTLVENSTKKRASITLVKGREGLEAHRRDGIDPTSSGRQVFVASLMSERRTLKRALTDPSSFDGIGNAYSDEILFAAKLAPTRLTTSLSDEESTRLAVTARNVLEDWTQRLKKLYPGFPKPSEITAFRPEFNVHGKYGIPCTVCGKPIQHIVYADKETNYCAVCQNGGKLLADRSLSRLLKEDWPNMLKNDD